MSNKTALASTHHNLLDKMFYEKAILPEVEIVA